MIKEEIQLIDDTFFSIKERIIEIFDTNKNRNKSDIFNISQLYFDFKDIPSELTKLLLNLPFDNYLLEKLDYLKDELEKEIIIKKSFNSLPSSLQVKRREYWDVLKNTILEIKRKISDEIYNNVFLEDLPNEDIELNRSQISLLMLYLRDRKAIKNLPDLVIAKHIGPLTGYSYKQLRLKVVSSAKSERNLITDKKADYNKLISLLKSIIFDIEQDMTKAKLK
jgi:hypothetical protein